MGRNRRTYGIVMIAIAGIFFVADIFAVYNVVDFYSHSEKSIGVVTDIKQISKGGNRGQGPTYRYTIQFVAIDGKMYATSVQSGNYELGDNVSVTYDKRDPLDSSASYWYIWIFVIICSLGALICFAIGYAKLHPVKPLETTVSYQVKVTEFKR